MSNKKSYMDKSNIINEGILDKIFDFITGGKIKQLEKDFKDDPEIKNQIKRIDQLSKKLQKRMNKQGYAWKPSEGGWVKPGEKR